MSTLIEAFGDASTVLDRLPAADIDALGLGDGISVVYDPASGSNLQVVNALVVGRCGTEVYALEPWGEAPSSTWGRRAFVLHTDDDRIQRLGARNFYEPADGYGHVPYYGYNDEDPEDGDFRPRRQGLGTVSKVVPNDDVDTGKRSVRHGVPWSRIHHKGAAMCYRLFEGGDSEEWVPVFDPWHQHGDYNRNRHLRFRLRWALDYHYDNPAQ